VLFYAARGFRQQADEFHLRRQEMSEQAELMRLQCADARSGHASAERIAEAAVRSQHTALIRLALEDRELAAVWPPYPGSLSDTQNRQFLYANQIISFQAMSYSIGYLTDDEVRSSLGYLFTSAIISEFWRGTRSAREQSSPYGGKMRKFY
jgi:hypothetical protein